MQSVSNTYKTIIARKEYYTETKAVINEVSYDEEQLITVHTARRVFNQDTPMIGSAVAGEVDIEMLLPPVKIPRMAEIRLYVRLVSTIDESISEWIPKGVYFIDTREATKNNDDLDIFIIHGYDAMLRAGVAFPSNSLKWPNTDNLAVVSFIANNMGVEIDSRTKAMLTRNYEIQLPSEYTMLETLGFIAGMYGGNFIINDFGELMLVTLYGLPEETFLLTDEYDNYLTFGGDRIYLGE